MGNHIDTLACCCTERETKQQLIERTTLNKLLLLEAKCSCKEEPKNEIVELGKLADKAYKNDGVTIVMDKQ